MSEALDGVAFNLQLLLLKSRDGWSDTSFKDLLRMLADTYLEGNKVPTNTYRTKMLIQPVAMKLEKFHACPNTVSYIGASMRTCKVVRTAAQVGTRGMLVVTPTWMMRDPRVGGGGGRRRSRSWFLRMRKKQILRAEEKSCPVIVVPPCD